MVGMQLIADFSSLGLNESKAILFILLVASVSIHIWVHAFDVDKIGYLLLREEGLLTIESRAHIDSIGTLLLGSIMINGS